MVFCRRLFCRACREEVGLKKSVINNHVQHSKKRSVGKERLAEKGKRKEDIAYALCAYNSCEHLAGEELPPEQQVYRVKVLTTFLKAGVPISKLDHFRELLQENGVRLAGRRRMSDLILFVQQEEQKRVKEEIKGRKVSVVFDGASRLGEAMAIILRFVDSSWKIHQRLIRLQLLAKSMSGEEIARELVSVLQVQYDVAPRSLVAAMHDRAAVNGVAMTYVRVMYPSLLDIGCFSHTLNNAGSKFNTRILNEFLSSWLRLFSHSPKARLAWRNRTGIAVKSHSETRWWSKWEVANQLMDLFGDLRPFLEATEDVGLVTCAKMRAILDDPLKSALLRLELAVTIDAGRPFVQATYRLEGDGPLALVCFEELDKLLQAIRVAHYPNVTRISELLAQGQPLVPQGSRYASLCVQPGFTYFLSKYDGDLKPAVSAFKAARLFNPHKIVDMQPSSDAINAVSALPFLNSGEILDNLKAELPQYLALATDISPQVDPVDWWQRNSANLPHWSNAASQVLLVQPSSAAAERVFSILNSCFTDQQETSLHDYIESSLMLQYNH